MLYHLLYVSTASKEMTREELLAILCLSKENNKKYNISGILIYRRRSFIQVLEGEQAVIKKLFVNIEKDERHYNVKLLISRPISKRLFPEWDMVLKEFKADSASENNNKGKQEMFSDMSNIERLIALREDDVVFKLIAAF